MFEKAFIYAVFGYFITFGISIKNYVPLKCPITHGEKYEYSFILPHIFEWFIGHFKSTLIVSRYFLKNIPCTSLNTNIAALFMYGFTLSINF